MKKFVIFALAAAALTAEEPQTDSFNLLSLETVVENLPEAREQLPAEQMAGHEMESFFQSAPVSAQPLIEADGNAIAHPTPLPPSALPDPAFEKQVAAVESQQIILNQASPKFVEKSLEAPLVAAAPKEEVAAEEIALSDGEIAELAEEARGGQQKLPGIMIDLNQVFAGSPTIYTILALLSIGSFCVWLYTFMSLRAAAMMPGEDIKLIREKLLGQQFDEVSNLCKVNNSILFKMVGTAVSSRSHGQSVMQEMMKSEGRRSSAGLWQKIALLNDIAIIAPMLGLLGTVLGMFYAFYDLNRSMESISALFDGLGISVGTTVAGLIVAIVAMIFHSLTKYRLVRQLNLIENEAVSLANLINQKGA